jgi:hypothetical protein
MTAGHMYTPFTPLSREKISIFRCAVLLMQGDGEPCYDVNLTC